MIKITVDNTGRAVDISLSPQALRLGSESIAEGMLEAFNEAQDDVQAETQRIVATAMPEGMTPGDAGQERMRARFDEIYASFDRAMNERRTASDARVAESDD